MSRLRGSGPGDLVTISHSDHCSHRSCHSQDCSDFKMVSTRALLCFCGPGSIYSTRNVIVHEVSIIQRRAVHVLTSRPFHYHGATDTKRLHLLSEGSVKKDWWPSRRCLPQYRPATALLQVRCHGGHGHSHDVDGSDEGEPISVRFAKGESFGSIFLSRMTKASGRRIGAVGLACAASWFDVLSMVCTAYRPFGRVLHFVYLKMQSKPVDE